MTRDELKSAAEVANLNQWDSEEFIDVMLDRIQGCGDSPSDALQEYIWHCEMEAPSVCGEDDSYMERIEAMGERLAQAMGI